MSKAVVNPPSKTIPASATLNVSRGRNVIASEPDAPACGRDRQSRAAPGSEPSPQSRLGAGNQASTALEGEIGPDPLDENAHPVTKTDEEKDMDNAPEQPGGKAADLDPAEIGHRAATPDGGQVARV